MASQVSTALTLPVPLPATPRLRARSGRLPPPCSGSSSRRAGGPIGNRAHHALAKAGGADTERQVEPAANCSAGLDRASSGPISRQARRAVCRCCYRARTRPRLDERTRATMKDRDVLLCQGLFLLCDFSSDCDLWLEELLGNEIGRAHV